MKITRVILGLGVVALTLPLLLVPPALATNPPTLAVPTGLTLAEVKITGDEYILLENNSGADIAAGELSNYWVSTYNSSNPLTSTSNSSQQLPAAALASGQTILLNSVGGSTCGAAVVDNLSLSLSDTTGFLQVSHSSFSGGTLSQTPVDSVSWTSSGSSSVYNAQAANITTPTTTSAKPAFASYRFQQSASPLTFWWQPASVDSNNTCQLDVTVSGSSIPGPSNPGSQLLAGLPPPAKIITLASSGGPSSLPASDIGLHAPQVTEVLPNPTPPTTDANGEFVELYNSNSSTFDLTNFVLQTGLTTKHKYTFPSGTVLKPNSFTAFLLKGTGLSLSNSSGQVVLIDPSGNVISQTDEYGSAKDGQSWALANGVWYWTTTPTPSAENLINQSGGGSSSNGNGPQILGASTQGGSGGGGSTGSGGSQPASQLHPLTLAGVGALAIGYALYEYRQDLANRFHQLNRYRAARATAGAKLAGRGGAGVSLGLGRWQNHLRSRASEGLTKLLRRK